AGAVPVHVLLPWSRVLPGRKHAGGHPQPGVSNPLDQRLQLVHGHGGYPRFRAGEGSGRERSAERTVRGGRLLHRQRRRSGTLRAADDMNDDPLRYLQFILLMFLMLFVIESLAQLVGVIVKNFVLGIAVFASCLSMFFIFNG
ncbi:unnamed protein product, partial [Ectocarpus sp. 12 AP-2014]